MKINGKERPIGIYIIIIIGLIIGAVTNIMNRNITTDYYIFENIDQCEELTPPGMTDVNIERYGTPAADKDRGKLKYDDFFGMNYLSDELEFEIFAYEFPDSDTALKYFVNVSGMDSYEKRLPLAADDENNLFFSTKGMFRYTIVIVHQNKAYKLNAPNSCEDELDELLSSVFSYKMPFSRKG